jgi:hypothetical protein
VPHAYDEHDANGREMDRVNVGDQRWMAFGQESGKSSMLFFLLSPQLQF